MSNDVTITEALTEEQGTRQSSRHYGIILISSKVMDHLAVGIDLSGCTIQGEFKDSGVFATLREKMLLPESYTIVAIFMRWGIRWWEIVVEHPDLPVLEPGCEPPIITPVYETLYEERADELVKSYHLKEIRIEGRQKDHNAA